VYLAGMGLTSDVKCKIKGKYIGEIAADGEKNLRTII
jgi:hypothetical protein